MDKITTASLWAQYLVLIPLGLVLLCAAITDWRERKVYNWLTYPAAGAGLLFHTIAFGWSGLLAGFITCFLVLFVGILILPLGWLGGGDIKLLAVIGAALGPGPLFHIFFYSLCVGMIMGLALSVINGYLLNLLRRIGRFFRSLFLTVVTFSNLVEDPQTDERTYLPFAIPIFIGGIFAATDAYLQWPLFLVWLQESMRAISPFL